MWRPRPQLRLAVFFGLAASLGGGLLAGLHLRSPSPGLAPPPTPAAFARVMPRTVLWAWEQPEDLHTLAPSVGIAYLAQTLLLGENTAVLSRRQPLRPPDDAALMTVVRVETRPGFADTPRRRTELADRIAEVVTRASGTRAVQIDFDAGRSERAFYVGVLRELRPRLPASMPLSITALASWCGPHSWLRGLPVDEAVPMLFRMGGPRAFAAGPHTPPALAEPLCRGSLGVSTDEPWPAALLAAAPAARLYVFAPRPWTAAELATLGSAPRAELERELLP